MLARLGGIFGSRVCVAPPVPQPLSGETIYGYIEELKRVDRDRLDDEVRNRGLSFGDLRVDAYGIGVEFSTPYQKTGSMSLESVKGILQDIVAEKELVGVIVEDGKMSNRVNLLLTEIASDALTGVCQSGWANGEPYHQQCFLEVSKHSGYPLSITAYSPEAIDVALHLARRLNLETEPATYGHESDVPLSEIVEYAYAWHDGEADKYYVEARYNADLVKHWVYIGGGRHSDYAEDGMKVVVLVSSHSAQRLKLNNRIVQTAKIKSPTRLMIATRDYIREQSKRECSVGDCGREAVNEVEVTRWDGGDASCGGIYYACDDSEHIETIKTTSGGIRATVRPAIKEVW